MRILVMAALAAGMAVSGAACGGKVVLDSTSSGTGATGGAGGAGGSVGTSGTGGFFGSSGSGVSSCETSGEPCGFDDDCCSGVCDSSMQCM